MHGAYPISNDDLRYVLSTFVVVPIRWIDSYGWRRFTETEKVASANYYRRLGTHMNIKAIPATYQDFIALADAYEREHFGFDEGGRAVAESTLKLLATFPPSDRLPAALVRRASFALMDDPLLDAFGFPHPNPLFRALVRAGLAARGRVVRVLPPRNEPRYARQLAEPAQLPRRLRHRPARDVPCQRQRRSPRLVVLHTEPGRPHREPGNRGTLKGSRRSRSRDGVCGGLAGVPPPWAPSGRGPVPVRWPSWCGCHARRVGFPPAIPIIKRLGGSSV